MNVAPECPVGGNDGAPTDQKRHDDLPPAEADRLVKFYRGTAGRPIADVMPAAGGSPAPGRPWIELTAEWIPASRPSTDLGYEACLPTRLSAALSSPMGQETPVPPRP